MKIIKILGSLLIRSLIFEPIFINHYLIFTIVLVIFCELEAFIN